MAKLSARLQEASESRLELCTIPGYGRCIRTLERVAAGELLAKERPIALGSSDGRSLAEVCVECEDLDAADDLIAACILLEMNTTGDAQEACAIAAELDASESESQLDHLLPCLSGDLIDTLTDAAASLRKWRGVCDVNAETWAEYVEGDNGNIRFLFGLFGALAMAEHSCQPNARVEWDVKQQTMRLVATEDIDAGQRVSRSYLDIVPLMSSVRLRQEALLTDWHFRCQCRRCKDEETSGSQLNGLDGVEDMDLQRCVEGDLKVDGEAVQRATAKCARFGLPAVGTLYFLQNVLADLQTHQTPILKLHCPSSESSPKRCKR